MRHVFLIFDMSYGFSPRLPHLFLLIYAIIALRFTLFRCHAAYLLPRHIFASAFRHICRYADICRALLRYVFDATPGVYARCC